MPACDNYISRWGLRGSNPVVTLAVAAGFESFAGSFWSQLEPLVEKLLNGNSAWERPHTKRPTSPSAYPSGERLALTSGR